MVSQIINNATGELILTHTVCEVIIQMNHVNKSTSQPQSKICRHEYHIVAAPTTVQHGADMGGFKGFHGTHF